MKNLLVVGKDKQTQNGKLQDVILFRHYHPLFENKEIYCAERWAIVFEEGPEKHLFSNNEENKAPDNDAPNKQELEPMMQKYKGKRKCDDKDVNLIRSLGLDVDDDNDPAPENIPNQSNEQDANAPTNLRWYKDPICQRKKSEAGIREPQCTQGKMYNWESFQDIFFLFLPQFHIEEMVCRTSSRLLKMSYAELTSAEFERWLGLWLMMSCFSFGGTRADYWTTSKPTIHFGAPYRFNKYMTKNRFDEILKHLQLTTRKPPKQEDKFWEVRELIDSFNKNMSEQFSPSWVTCLDESMSIWFSKWTCPGWMFVP